MPTASYSNRLPYHSGAMAALLQIRQRLEQLLYGTTLKTNLSTSDKDQKTWHHLHMRENFMLSFSDSG
jgi:hypothetical protein